MISFIRSLINSRWGAVFALAFVALIALAFALGDVTNGGFGGVGGGNVARVGGKAITEGEFREALDNRMRAERRQNPTLDMAQFVQAGGFDATLEQLINGYALTTYAEKYGMSVSKRLVDSEIRKLPGMLGLDGKFSEDAFRGFLENNNLSEQMVRTNIYQTLMAQQTFVATAGGPNAADGVTLPYASLQLERRSGQVASIASTDFFPANPPTDAVLAQYYKANAVKFTIPEKRAISYAMFDSEVVAARAKPSEADIAAYYKANAKTYAASESRDISQVIVGTESAAKSLADRVAKGESLDAGAKALGLSVSSNAAATRESLTTSASKAVADAVFAAPVGKLAVPAKGQLGWSVIRVNSVKAVAARPLAAVRSEIEQQLNTARREEMLSEFTSEIEDAFANGDTIADVAKVHGLKVETSPKMLANGQVPNNPGYRPIEEMRVIIPAAFQMERDGDAQLVEIVPGKRFAMVAVADFEEAAPPPLADVKAIVQRQWALTEGAKKAREAAEKVRKAIDSGKSLQDALTASGVKAKIETLSGVRSELENREKPVSPPLSLMFAMKQGTAKLLQGGQNVGWYVVKLDQVIKGDATGNKALLDQRKAMISAAQQQEYAQQLVAAAIKEVGVEKDEDALAALRKALTSRDNSQ